MWPTIFGVGVSAGLHLLLFLLAGSRIGDRTSRPSFHKGPVTVEILDRPRRRKAAIPIETKVPLSAMPDAIAEIKRPLVQRKTKHLPPPAALPVSEGSVIDVFSDGAGLRERGTVSVEALRTTGPPVPTGPPDPRGIPPADGEGEGPAPPMGARFIPQSAVVENNRAPVPVPEGLPPDNSASARRDRDSRSPGQIRQELGMPEPGGGVASFDFYAPPDFNKEMAKARKKGAAKKMEHELYKNTDPGFGVVCNTGKGWFLCREKDLKSCNKIHRNLCRYAQKKEQDGFTKEQFF